MVFLFFVFLNIPNSFATGSMSHPTSGNLITQIPTQASGGVANSVQFNRATGTSSVIPSGTQVSTCGPMSTQYYQSLLNAGGFGAYNIRLWGPYLASFDPATDYFMLVNTPTGTYPVTGWLTSSGTSLANWPNRSFYMLLTITGRYSRILPSGLEELCFTAQIW